VLRVAVPLKCGRDSCMHVIFRHVRAIELGLRRAVVAGPAPAPPPGALTAVINRTDNAGDYAPAPESGHKDRSTSFCTDAPEPNRVQKLHTHEARHSCEHFQNHVPSQHSAHRSCRARVQSSCYPISGPKMPPYRSYTAELYVYPDACSESSHPDPSQPATTCDHDEDFHATYPSDHGQKGSCISRAGMSPCPPWRREGVCMRSRARRLNPFWGQPDLGLSEIVRAPD
jgi:hypothetical protein